MANSLTVNQPNNHEQSRHASIRRIAPATNRHPSYPRSIYAHTPDLISHCGSSSETRIRFRFDYSLSTVISAGLFSPDCVCS